MRERLQALELDQCIERFNRRRKLARMTHDLKRAQAAAHLRNEIERIEGVMLHRLHPGLQQHALFEHQKTKLRNAMRDNLFDVAP